MKLIELTDDQMIVFEKTGKITTENLFYDFHTGFLYISLRKKLAEDYFTNRLDVKNKLTLFYENNTVDNDITHIIGQLSNMDFDEFGGFLGKCNKRYNGLQITEVSKYIHLNTWNLPYIEIYEFPYLEDDEQYLYFIINFVEEDPFNYTEEEYEKINEDIGILWSEVGKIKQITIKTSQ